MLIFDHELVSIDIFILILTYFDLTFLTLISCPKNNETKNIQNINQYSGLFLYVWFNMVQLLFMLFRRTLLHMTKSWAVVPLELST